MGTLEATITPLDHWRGRRIVVAMSGGVDSAVAAALLHRAGAEVIGVHMRTWHYRDCGAEQTLATCCSPADARDARAVADRFGFPFYAIDFQANFREQVIEPFIGDYLAGRTPNPCVNCNNRLKLGSLLEKGEAYGAEAVATGHYGRVARNGGGRWELRMGADADKDQTYYLYGLEQRQLARLVMPLGELDKPAVRALARELGIAVAEKPDSVEICFVTDNDYRRFLREEARLDEAALAGAIVTTRGQVVGRHQGIHNFTIGQRRGIGIAAARPLYVVELLPETRTVVIGQEEDLLACGLEMEGINWVALAPMGEPFRARLRIRHRGALHGAWIEPDPVDHSRARVRFDRPVRAVTPGQAAVAYDDEDGTRVLCGGTIGQRRAAAPPEGEAAAM